MAKTLWSFGHPECKRVKGKVVLAAFCFSQFFVLPSDQSILQEQQHEGDLLGLQDRSFSVCTACCLSYIMFYPISSVIRPSFFSFQNNPKDLDPSYMTDLIFLDRLGRVKLVL